MLNYQPLKSLKRSLMCSEVKHNTTTLAILLDCARIIFYKMPMHRPIKMLMHSVLSYCIMLMQ